MNGAGAEHGARLERELGLLHAVGIGLGAVMGAGIFVVIGVAAGVAGPAFLIGLIVAGCAATFNGLSSAQLAARYPQSGGTYEYGYELLGPRAGFAAGWMFLASKLAAAGTVAIGFGHYASVFLPKVPAHALANAAVLLVVGANLAGIKKAGVLNLGIVFVTLLALGCFVVAGLPKFHTANFHPFAPNGGRAIAESSALLFFAYTGYARLATLGEEVREPEKTIPKAIVTTLALSFVIYLAVGIVAVGAVGSAELARGASPLQQAATRFGKPAIHGLLSVGAATAMFGVMLSQVLGISRMILAMARRGDLPRALAKVNEKRGVPARGILLTGTITVVLVLAGRLESVIAAAAFTILLYYSVTNLAAMKLAPAVRLYQPWVAWAGLITCLAMAASLPLRTVGAGVLLLVAGFVLRSILHRVSRRGLPTGRTG